MSRAFNLTAEINLRGPSNIRTVVADIRRQLGSVDININPRISPATARNITRLNTDLQRLNNTLSSTTNIANNASASLRNLGQSLGSIGANNALQNLNNTVTACQNLGRAAGGAGGNVGGAATQMEEFGRQSALAVRRFAAFSLAAGTISAFTRAVYNGVNAFIAFDKEFVRLQQVTGESAKSLQSLASEITRLSTGLGVASSDLTTVAVTLAQAGLSASDTRKALDALAKSSLAPSFDDMNETVEGSIALMRQFGIGAGDLESALGSINSVAAKFAVEASDIITAIQRTGGVFATASKGVSEGTDALNEFIAIFTSVRQTTRESAETIATGLRTIFTRIQRGGTIEALKEYGVVLTDLEGKFVGPYEAVRRLSEGLSQIDPRDIRFSQIVEELGGFRQIGKVIPLIQQFAVAQQALKVAQTGQASLAEDAATAQLSLANQLAKVREEFTALIRSIGESESFRSFLSLSLQLASGLIQLADAAKNVLPALTAIATIRGASALFQYGAGFGRGLGGGGARRFASGGMVPGSGNRDTVPAMLTPGEFVIRKKAVEAIGAGRLHSMNRYAGGGIVQKFAQTTAMPESGRVLGRSELVKKLGISATSTSKAGINRYNLLGEKSEKGEKYRRRLSRLANKKQENDNDINGINLNKAFGVSFLEGGVSAISSTIRDVLVRGNQTGAAGLNKFIGNKKIARGARITAPNAKSSTLSQGGKDIFDQSIMNGLPSLFDNAVEQLPEPLKPGRGQVSIDQLISSSAKQAIKGYFFEAFIRRASQNLLKDNDTTDPIFDFTGVGNKQALNRLFGGRFITPNEFKVSPTPENVANAISKAIAISKPKDLQAFAAGGSVSDTVPALLTPGEFVINKKAAKRIGGSRLHQLNKADKIQGFNKGGAVGHIQKFFFGGRPRNVPAGGGWTGNNVTPLSNFGVGSRSPGMSMGGMGGFIALTAGGAAVDSIGNAIGDIAGNKIAATVFKSAGSDALNFGAIGSTLGSFFGPQGAFIGAVLGGAIGLGKALFSYADTVAEAEKQITQEKLNKAIETGVISSSAFTQTLKVEDRTKAFKDLQQTAQLESELFGKEKFNSQSKLGDMLKTQESAAKAAETILIAEIKRTGKTFEELSTSIDPNDFQLLVQQIGEGSAVYQQALKERAAKLEAAKDDPVEQAKINQQYNKKLSDISNEAALLVGLTTQSVVRQQAVNQILDNIIDRYRRVQGAIENFGNEIDNIKNSVLNNIRDFEGGPSVPEVSRSGEKVLANIRGSSDKQIGAVADTLKNVVGGEVGQTLASNLQASKSLIDLIPNALQNAEPDNIEDVMRRITDNVKNVPAFLLDDIKKTLEEGRKDSDKKSFKELANDPELLSKVSKNIEESNKTAAEALKEYYDSLQAVTDLQNKYIDTLSRADEYQRKAIDIRLNSELDLKKLYGQNLSLQEANEPVNQNIRALTGGTTDPNQILQIIKDAQQEGLKLQEQRQAIPQGDAQAIKDSTEAYTKNRLKLKNATDALKLVADNASRAANALSKIGEKKQRLDNLTNSVEQLLVAGPEEVLNFNQQAAAFAASKNAGADFFKSTKNRQLAFGGLNQIKDIMGEEQYRNARADLVEKSLTAQLGDPEKVFKNLGIGISFKDYIKNIRTGEISDQDPTVKEYKKIVGDSVTANNALSQIIRDQAAGIQTGIDTILSRLANELPKIIQDAYKQINVVAPQQPNQQPKPPVAVAPAAGTAPAAPLTTEILTEDDVRVRAWGAAPPMSSGGIVYASKGQMINFQPKGTDTVPAMLTPGEFVINKDSTKANMGLLEAINNSKTQYAFRGGVIYAATGGGMGTSLKPDPEIREATAFFKQYGTGVDSGGPGTASLEEVDDSLFSNQDNLNAILTGKYSMGNVENMPELAKSILQSEMDEKNRQLEYDLYNNLSRFEDPKSVKVDDLLSYLGQEHSIFDSITDTDMTDQQKSQAREVATRRIEEMQKKYKFTPEEAKKITEDHYGDIMDQRLTEEIGISNRAQAERYRQQATGEISVDAKTKQIAREQVNSIESIKGLKPTDWAYKDKLAENRKKYLERKKAGTVNNTPQTQYHSMLRERKARYNAEMQSRRDNYQNSTGARKQQPMLSKEEKKLKLERIQSLNRSMANAQLPKDREARKLALLNRHGATKRVNYPRAAQSEGRLSERDLSLLREARDEAERDAEVGLTRRKSYDPRGRGTQSPLYTSTGYSGGGKINPANGLYMPGMAGRDDMIAKVGTGEFITNESSTKKYRPLLEAINRSKGGPIPIPGFADGTSSGGGSTKSTGGFNGFSIDLSNESKSSMDKFIIDFGSYVDKLSNISLPTVPDTIEMTGNHVVDVRVTGAAAFESLQDGIKNMIDTKINEKMGEIWTQSGGQLGKAPSLPGKK
jgi:TP901 family phage tail tape measure protein